MVLATKMAWLSQPRERDVQPNTIFTNARWKHAVETHYGAFVFEAGIAGQINSSNLLAVSHHLVYQLWVVCHVDPKKNLRVRKFRTSTHCRPNLRFPVPLFLQTPSGLLASSTSSSKGHQSVYTANIHISGTGKNIGRTRIQDMDCWGHIENALLMIMEKANCSKYSVIKSHSTEAVPSSSATSIVIRKYFANTVFNPGPMSKISGGIYLSCTWGKWLIVCFGLQGSHPDQLYDHTGSWVLPGCFW